MDADGCELHPPTELFERRENPVADDPRGAFAQRSALKRPIGRTGEDVMDAVSLWPRKFEVFGVSVSATTYDQAAEAILAAAKERRSATVTHLSSHGLTMAATD